MDFDAPHAIEGSSNRAHFVGFDLDGFWEEIRIWKKVYVLYIFVNKKYRNLSVLITEQVILIK